MILSPALQPIPARLVRRILAGEFVEMRELLADNIALHDQLESVHGPLHSLSTPGSLRARIREVPSLISWVYCMAAYVAVRTRDSTTRDMLAYMRLIVREAMRHGGGGGGGWQEYDRSFRNQAAIDPTLRWNTLLPDLQASTILGHGMGRGTYCSLCRGVDHQAAQCALTYLQQPLVSSQQSPTAAAISRPPTDSRSRASRPAYRICTSWNLGSCIYPGTCTFRHICLVCRQSHRAKDCPDAPADSFHRRTPRPAAPTSAASAKR